MGFARHQVDRTLRGVGRSDRERASADDDAVVAVVAYLAPRDGRAFPCLTAVDAVGVARTQAGPDALRHGASVYDAVSVLVGVALLLEKREGVGPVYRDVFEFGVVALVEHDGMDAGVRLVGLDVHDHQIPDLLACAPRSVLDGPEEVVTELFECGVVARVADRVAVMYAGKIVEIGTAEEVYYDPRHPYTWGLMRSLPAFAKGKESLYTIPGMPPTLINPPKGDAFACRNEYALNIDYEEMPPMFKITDTHYAATWLLDPRAPQIKSPVGGTAHE